MYEPVYCPLYLLVFVVLQERRIFVPEVPHVGLGMTRVIKPGVHAIPEILNSKNVYLLPTYLIFFTLFRTFFLFVWKIFDNIKFFNNIFYYIK